MSRPTVGTTLIPFVAGVCLGQTDTGTLTGTVVIENGDERVRSVSVKGVWLYDDFQVQAFASRFQFTKGGLRNGDWIITATGFGFCSSPITKYITASSNQNVLMLAGILAHPIENRGRDEDLLARIDRNHAAWCECLDFPNGRVRNFRTPQC
jgi:hypothetical protein